MRKGSLKTKVARRVCAIGTHAVSRGMDNRMRGRATHPTCELL